MTLHVESKTVPDRDLTRYSLVGTRKEVEDAIASFTTDPEIRAASFYGPWRLEGPLYGAMGQVIR